MTKIEWTHLPGYRGETLNPFRARGVAGRGWHCEHVSEGCRNCYAERMNGWRGTGLRYKPGFRKDVELFLDEKTLLKPLGRRQPRAIFWCDMTDAFGDWVPDEWLDCLWAVFALTPQHIHMVLTKRPERMREYLNSLRENAADRLERAARELGFDDEATCALANVVNGWSRWASRPADSNPLDGTVPQWPLPNCWLGTSAEDQQTADARIPELLATPAEVRFVSAEPLLSAIDLTEWLHESDCPIREEGFCVCKGRKQDGSVQEGRLDWTISGGESGPNARPAHPDWFYSIRDQCQPAGVPFFFKQWGAWRIDIDYVRETGLPDERYIRASDAQYINGHPELFARVGKKAAGAMLDGREWRQFPEVA